MQDEFDADSSAEVANNNTLYQIAREAMTLYVQIYLELSKQTSGFANIQADQIVIFEQKLIILSGLDSSIDPTEASPQEVVQELFRMQAVPFDVESAITKGVYIQLRNRVENLLNELYASPDVAAAIYEYLQGDRSKLKWQVNFSITAAN